MNDSVDGFVATLKLAFAMFVRTAIKDGLTTSELLTHVFATAVFTNIHVCVMRGEADGVSREELVLFC